MGFWDSIKKGVSDLKQGLTDEVARFRDADTAAGIVAALAYITAADGTAAPEEIAGVSKFIATHPLFQVFDRAAIGRKYNEYVTKALDTFAKYDVEEAIMKVAGKPSAPTVMRVAVDVAALGGIDAAEKAALAKIAELLGLDAAKALKDVA